MVPTLKNWFYMNWIDKPKLKNVYLDNVYRETMWYIMVDNMVYLLVPRTEHHLRSFKCGFLNIFSRQNLLRSLSCLLFLLRWNKDCFTPQLLHWFHGPGIISAASNVVFWTFFLLQNLLCTLSRLLFLLRWNKCGAKNVWKTTFHSTFELIQL